MFRSTVPYHGTMHYVIEEESDRREGTAVRGTELIQFHAALQIYHQDDLKKLMKRRTDTWQNGCLVKNR